MHLWQMIVISIGLSFDVFAFFLYKGAMVSEVRKVSAASAAAVFTGFQMGMLVLGNAVTEIPAIKNSYASANRIWTALAAVTFFCLGIYMIVKAVRKDRHRIIEKKQDDYNYRVIIPWALITSVDALIAGIGFGFVSLRLLGTVIIVGVTTAVSAVTGLICGYLLGCGPMNKLVMLGGCMVLFGGFNLLVNYLVAVF